MANFEAEAEGLLPRGVRGRGSAVPDAWWPSAADLVAAGWGYDRKARPEQLLLGFRTVPGERTARAIGVSDNRHVLLCAGSRAGKTVSFLAPNLLLYDGSCLVLDPKGELAALTARQRLAKGQRVFILDPFGVSGARDKPHLQPCLASYNPLLDLDPRAASVIDDAAALAGAVIEMPAQGEKHWAEAAQALLQAIILEVVSTVAEKDRHFGTVRAVLTGNDPFIRDFGIKEKVAPEAALGVYLKSRGRLPVVGPVVASIGNWLLEMGEKERGSVMSAARTQTSFLDSPELVRAMSASSFRIAELKTGVGGGSSPLAGLRSVPDRPAAAARNVTLYVCLPASLMATHNRWMRLMISLALIAFERTRLAADVPADDVRRLPVLFVLEELATTIGYSRQIEKAAGLMAGFGVKLISVVQDLGQLKQHYGDGWETFVGNSGVSIFFGNSDTFTLRHISDKLGKSSFLVTEPSGASQRQLQDGARPTNERLQTVPLLDSAEAELFLGRDRYSALILPAGQSPFYVERTNYRVEPALKGLYDPTADA